MHQEIETPPIQKSNNGLDFKDIFQLIFHISLSGGIILSILFFTFYVEAFPSVDNISQLSSYIITVFGVALFFVVYLSFTMLTPSLLIISNKSNTFKRRRLIVGWAFISLSIFISVYFNSILGLWGLLFLLGLPIKVRLYKKFWIISLYLPYKVFFVKWKKHIQKSYAVLSYFIIPWGMYFLFSALFVSIFTSKIPDNILYTFSIFLLQFMILFSNSYLIIENKTFSDIQNNLKKITTITITIVFIFIAIISFIFISAKKPNPIIVAPFSILKLGYYKAELHFKEDFINKSKPFILNETNQTSNIFFVLSSVGDEYIIKEIKYAHYIADDNTSHDQLFAFTYCNELYYCEDENFSKIWRLNDKNQLTQLKNVPLDFNLSIKKEFNRWKQWKEPIYRIKKDNIAFEIVGKEIEAQSTIWKHSPKDANSSKTSQP